MNTAYVDANILVAALDEVPSPLREAARLLLRRTSQERQLATSVLTADEVVWAYWKQRSRESGLQAGRRLLEFPGLRFLDIRGQILPSFLHGMEQHRLEPRDAIHLAVALSHHCDRFLSTDPDFDAVPGLQRVGLEP